MTNVSQDLQNCPTMEKVLSHGLSYRTLLEIITFDVILNVILALSATFGNGMIIVAILRSQNLQTPSYLLIKSLAFIDLQVGLVFHPFQIVWRSYYLHKNYIGICRMDKLYFCLMTYFGGVPLVMVTCISIDRYLALTLRHRYTIIVTKKRVGSLIAGLWILCLLLAILTLVENLRSTLFIIATGFVALVLVLLVSFFYIKSFHALHLYTVQIHAQQPNPLAAGNFDVVRYKKTLKTMVVFVACLLLCYVPGLLCTALVFTVFRNSPFITKAYFVSLTLMCFNSSINPVIYLIRFADIRNACHQLFTRNLVN